jgi:D-beta-D-heptose 7-phosphate kinase/D-beta-D-heptose 1-phosphate adenosyltransferase
MENLENYRQELYANLKENYDAVIFSDYNKGVFADNCHPRLERLNYITVVDPKINTDIHRWVGCTVFKPNESEAKNLSGLSDWKEQADYFCNNLGCKSVVITQEGRGVVGRYNGDYFEYRPTKKIILESPIGGGDTFVAFMAMSLAYGLTLPEAVEVAFNAGAVYVGKRHNEPITPYELLRYADPIKAKIVNPDFLAEVSRNEKLNMINGCWDSGLHLGHISCLSSAKELGGKLVVAVNGNESVKRLKGESRPILDVQERMMQVAALECVDFVVSFDEETPYELIKKVMPAAIVKASEYKIEDVVGRDLVPVILVPYVDGYSTTKKLAKIRQY